MPHFIVEYTGNLKAEGRIPELLQKASQVLQAQDGIFAMPGIRCRAIQVDEYYIADGDPENAYIHAHFKIGPGRSSEEIKRALDALFEMMKDHFKDQCERRGIALSLEFTELGAHSRYRHGNLHERMKLKS